MQSQEVAVQSQEVEKLEKLDNLPKTLIHHLSRHQETCLNKGTSCEFWIASVIVDKLHKI